MENVVRDIRVLYLGNQDWEDPLLDELKETAKSQPLFEIDAVFSKKEAIHHIFEHPPHVLLINDVVRDGDVKAIAKQIESIRNDGQYIGMILIHNVKSLEEILAFFQLGFDDFCSPAPLEIMARIHSVYKFKTTTDSLRESNFKLQIANKKLSKMSITDDLTKLNNMRYFQRRLSQEFSRARRYDEPLSIVMIDLDHFKKVNDSCGHLMGSHVLREVGKMIVNTTRLSDIAARYGGDEFILLLPQTPVSGAKVLAERILKGIAETVFQRNDDESQIVASFGTSTYLPDQANYRSELELIHSADKHLYEAKAKGGACVITDDT